MTVEASDPGTLTGCENLPPGATVQADLLAWIALGASYGGRAPLATDGITLSGRVFWETVRKSALGGGRFAPCAYDPSARASVSRAITRLVRRGLVRRDTNNDANRNDCPPEWDGRHWKLTNGFDLRLPFVTLTARGVAEVLRADFWQGTVFDPPTWVEV